MSTTIFVTCKDAAELSGMSSRYWRRRCERGEIEAVKLGHCWRIRRDALLRVLGLSEEEVI